MTSTTRLRTTRSMAAPSLLLLVGALFLPPSAEAAEVHTANGHVIGDVQVTTTVEAALALLSDSQRMVEVEGRGAKVTLVTTGTCDEHEIVAPSAIAKVRYHTRTCATDSGFHTTLVSSPDFETFTETWTVSPSDGGVRISYDLYTVPKLPVPQGTVAFLSKWAVQNLLERVQQELERSQP